MINKYKPDIIAIAGDGWGAIALYEGLIDKYKTIEVVTKDPDLIKLLNSKCKLINNLNELNSKLLICSGYKPIIQKNILDSIKVINIHYSMLPKYRGLHSVVWAILNGEEEIGLSIHLMNEFLDDGPILYQYSLKNNFSLTSSMIIMDFNEHIRQNISSIIYKYCNGKIKEITQNKEDATWFGRRNMSDCQIHFTYENVIIERMLNALTDPYPRPHIIYNRKMFFVYQLSFHSININYNHIGRILNIDNEGVYVSSKDGFVIIKELRTASNEQVNLNIFKLGTYINI
jgi:methionyl-tRNA formyltransferase